MRFSNRLFLSPKGEHHKTSLQPQYCVIHLGYILGYEEVYLIVDKNGRLLFKHKNEKRLTLKELNNLSIMHAELFYKALNTAADFVNKELDELMNFHHKTPPPNKPDIIYFNNPIPYPKQPKIQAVKALHYLMGVAEKIEQQNRKNLALFQQAVAYWNAIQLEHQRVLEQLKQYMYQAERGDLVAIKHLVTHILHHLKWPKHLEIHFSVTNKGRLHLDLDVTALHDTPTKTCALGHAGNNLFIKSMSVRQLRDTIHYLLHGLLFRIIGELFSVLATVETVILSAYMSQFEMKSRSIHKHCILSLLVDKNRWSDIHFQYTDVLNPISELERFQMRKNLDRSGLFCPVQPF